MIERFRQTPPNMKATKDKVGTARSALPRSPGTKLAIWAAGGGTGNPLMLELPLGFGGLCPTLAGARNVLPSQEKKAAIAAALDEYRKPYQRG